VPKSVLGPALYPAFCLGLTRRNDLSKSFAKPLDATLFSQHPTDYVAYALAGRIPKLLAEQPCFCPCHFIHHHQSLLDYFAGQHGRECGICKQEVIFCHEQQRQGKSRRQIRKGLSGGAWTKIDVESYTKAFLSQTNGPENR
jgi:hypothetical protein